MERLHITSELMEELHAAARASGRVECMGLLASAAGSQAATHSQIIQAAASSSHAQASPAAIAEAALALRARGLVPRGIWHSHGALGVFHSATDHDTVDSFLPAMAAWSFERPAAGVKAPAVTSPDTASLPLEDGRLLTFTILGEPLDGTDARERVRWTRVETLFEKPGRAPRAWLEDGRLRLESSGVTLSLGIPEGATVTARKIDPADVKLARVYSLVINTRGDAAAKCLVVVDSAGTSYTQLCSCEVVLPDGTPVASAEAPEDEKPRGLLARIGL